MLRLVQHLNHLYRSQAALHEVDCEPMGFRWISCDDAEQSVVAFLRRAHDPDNYVLVVCNFTPVPRHHYRLGVPRGGYWQELLNTDAAAYGGSNVGNGGGVWAEDVPEHEQPSSAVLTLPPLAALFLQPR